MFIFQHPLPLGSVGFSFVIRIVTARWSVNAVAIVSTPFWGGRRLRLMYIQSRRDAPVEV